MLNRDERMRLVLDAKDDILIGLNKLTDMNSPNTESIGDLTGAYKDLCEVSKMYGYSEDLVMDTTTMPH